MFCHLLSKAQVSKHRDKQDKLPQQGQEILSSVHQPWQGQTWEHEDQNHNGIA